MGEDLRFHLIHDHGYLRRTVESLSVEELVTIHTNRHTRWAFTQRHDHLFYDSPAKRTAAT